MSTVHPPGWAPAARALAVRLLGDLGHRVTFTGLDRPRLDRPGRQYVAEASAGHLTVGATDIGSAAVGLHTYLRRHCGLEVSWEEPRPPAPAHLPDAAELAGSARVAETYYLNFCTFGYTTPWWDWTRWEEEIDWMALRGITTPLMLLGHEAVLHRVLTDEGLSEDEVGEFLSGPAYFPWLAMGNLDGHAGPPPSGWIEAHRDLAGRVLTRQRELGMRPVLPAFTGHVPHQLAPDAHPRTWQGHQTRVLDPQDPRFAHLTAAVVRAQQELWGTDHRYAADPFIEMPPAEDDPGHPGRVAAALHAGLTDADPQAEWFLQTWPFSYDHAFWTPDRVRTFLADIPGRVTLLDLWAETQPQWPRFDGFAGGDWMWCALLNFGGRTDPVADLPGLDGAIEAALTSPNPPTGLGLAMEATRVTGAYYERVLDLAWQDAPSLADWLTNRAGNRYQLTGTQEQHTAAGAWHDLADTVLGSGDYLIFPEAFTGLVTQRPSGDPFAGGRLAQDVTDLLWYDPDLLVRAWRRLLEVAETRPERVAGPLGHDLVEVALAVLPRCAELAFLAGYHPGGVADPEAAAQFFTVLEDLEELLATRPEYRYDTWEDAALAWAQDQRGRELLADNARRLVTVWGQVGDGYLDDYSARLWSGLVGYYRDRWSCWAAMHPITPGDEPLLEDQLQAIEEDFLTYGPRTDQAADPAAAGPAHRSAGTAADTLTVSRRLLERYSDFFPGAVRELRTRPPEPRAVPEEDGTGGKQGATASRGPGEVG